MKGRGNQTIGENDRKKPVEMRNFLRRHQEQRKPLTREEVFRKHLTAAKERREKIRDYN